MQSPRQTQTYLRNLFARHGIAPRHRYGQNFLVDLNIHDLIVKSAEVGPGDVVLEVGPGAGALTTQMAATGAAVVAVDIDPGMAMLTTEATVIYPNVRVLHVDALKGKNKLNPKVLDNIKAGLAVAPDRRFKLVANLPYNAATPIIGNLLVHPEIRIERMVVTIQLELAQRMLAPPDSDDYGALSVLVQALSDASLVRTLPPSVFWPRPSVDSAVLMIVPNEAKRAEVGDVAWFHTVVRTIFLHRRKNLRRVLYSHWRDRWTKEEVDTILEGIGLTGLVRAEAMTVDQHITLAKALRARIGPDAPTDDEDEGEDEDGEEESEDADEDDADEE
ncbi:16S rRNA (adenine(1518)-N(6)/adenine(1519)-N(6))-dimethyltransferase RsmA [Tundrisphaera sp. TA3]|uniref:16S rRNA (adenine(1518)-N(6)/adenine(1519)-N(6))- dimethyltransferase RsmA n=1 Tax=Tundrisphaera sp. TA3 TaxID=3435775 RepID=UPI003EBBF885